MKPYLKKTLHTHTHTNRGGGVAQDESPEFKPQHCKKKGRKKRNRSKK
jgi:hypothetical protein